MGVDVACVPHRVYGCARMGVSGDDCELGSLDDLDEYRCCFLAGYRGDGERCPEDGLEL